MSRSQYSYQCNLSCNADAEHVVIPASWAYLAIHMFHTYRGDSEQECLLLALTLGDVQLAYLRQTVEDVGVTSLSK